MSRSDYIFTSESVSEGHPDKVCDRISDAVLDAFLTEEPNARVACETFATTNTVVVGGEVGLSTEAATKSMLERVESIVRGCVRDIGYEQEKFHWNTLKVHNLLHEQSAHIAQGVDRDGAAHGWLVCAGDFPVHGAAQSRDAAIAVPDTARVSAGVAILALGLMAQARTGRMTPFASFPFPSCPAIPLASSFALPLSANHTVRQSAV